VTHSFTPRRTPQDLERHLAQIAEEKKWAPATVNRYRALISLVFRLGIENGKVKENPVRLVKPRQVNNTRTRWLAPVEEVRLRAAIEAACPDHMPELDLGLNTGLRRSELYGLTWENVNVSQRVLTIPRSKNGQTRHVPINSVALAALTELRKRGNGTGRVIRNPEGEPLAGPRYWFEPAIGKAKIRAFSWHCLADCPRASRAQVHRHDCAVFSSLADPHSRSRRASGRGHYRGSN
jgi:integrase